MHQIIDSTIGFNMSKKIKIIFFLPTLTSGGAQRVAINMMSLLDRRKYDISLVLVTNHFNDLLDAVPSDIKIYNLDSKKTILSVFKLRRIIKKIEPEIIFSTLINSNVVMYLALLGIKNKPKIIYRHPTSPKLLLEEKTSSPIMRYLLVKAYAHADEIVAQTPEMKNEIIKYYGVDKNKIEVFINPLDSNNIDEKIKNIENPFDKNKINIVSAGRLSREKGFDVLINAFKNVIDHDKNAVLHIIGTDGGEKEKLLSLIEKLNMKDHIVFWGFQKNPYRFFFFSDLYVLASRREGLPNVVLENQYLGKPVISTKCIPFMEELIVDGENGFLVDVEDVDGLSEAIINYKKLSNTKQVFVKSGDVNKLFFFEKK